MTEPCPFCGARIIPLREGEIKVCPVCRGRWFDSGSGSRTRYYPGGAGGSGACITIRDQRRKTRYQLMWEG